MSKNSQRNKFKINPTLLLLISSMTAILFIGIFYFLLIYKIIGFPFASTLFESWNFVYVSCLSHSGEVNALQCPSLSFAHSPLFLILLKTLTQIASGTGISHADSPIIFLISRLISLSGLFVSLALLWLIQAKEGIKPLARLASILILISTPVVQELALQSPNLTWALAFGLAATFRFMTYVRQSTLRPALLIGSGLALAFILSHNFAFLAFPIACFIIQISVQNWSGLKKLALVFSSLLLLDTLYFIFLKNFAFAFSNFSSVNSGFVEWNASGLTTYSDFFYSWPLLAFLLLLIFLARHQLDLSNNPIHPGYTIALFTLPINFILSSTTLYANHGYLVTLVSLAWLAGCIINKLLENKNPRYLLLLSSFILCLGLLTPFLKTKLIKLLDENPKLLESTQNWQARNSTNTNASSTSKSGKRTSRRKRKSQMEVFSQDPSLNILANVSPEEIYENTTLFQENESSTQSTNSSTISEIKNNSSRNNLVKAISKQSFTQILASSSLALPSSIQKTIKQKYVTEEEILLAGAKGFVLVPGFPNEENSYKAGMELGSKSSSDHKHTGFASFSRR